MKLILDFETANVDPDIDLPEVGVEAYARHPLTEILCLVIKWPSGCEWAWRPGDDTEALRTIAANPDVTFEAHNAFFEQMIWKHIMVPKFGMPEIPIPRWSCTQAASYYRGLPGGLDKTAKIVGLTEQKDMEASQFTINLSKPMTQLRWMQLCPETVRKKDWRDVWQAGSDKLFDREPDTMDRVQTYCIQDCRVEFQLSHVVGPLSPYERKVWELDQTINQRGVRIDVPFVEQALKIVRDTRDPMLREFDQLTGGLAPTQDAKVREWCAAHGLKLASLDKPTMKRLGIGEDVDEDGPTRDMPPEVRRVLEIRAMLGSASIKKLARMLVTLGEGGRVRGLLQYHGAGPGRWAGRLWQPQNFPRGLITVDAIKDGKHVQEPPPWQELVDVVRSGDWRYAWAMYGNPIAAVASALRGAIIPADDHLFGCGDFAGIEMRVVLALAGQTDKTALLATGADVYLDMACDIYKVPKGSLTKKDVEKRTIGKNTVLGCGFQMGGDTFHDRYCSHMTLAFAKDVVNAYRKVWAPTVPNLWYGLENAALAACEGRTTASSHGIVYEHIENGSHKWLACHLPDGQTMWYYNPRYFDRLPPGSKGSGTWRDKPHWKYFTWKEGQWTDTFAYGGLLTENVVQKLARGILVSSLYRLEANGYPVILTVHDEALTEPHSAYADYGAFKQIMAEPSECARALGVPIDIEGFVEDRYRK